MSDRPQFHRQLTSNINLGAMALAIIKRDAMHFIILLQSLHQAGRRILSSTEDNYGAFHGNS